MLWHSAVALHSAVGKPVETADDKTKEAQQKQHLIGVSTAMLMNNNKDLPKVLSSFLSLRVMIQCAESESLDVNQI